jgi:DMSO/TMAO reductase YedYZ molybdopterin-dependent catalytic subunit
MAIVLAGAVLQSLCGKAIAQVSQEVRVVGAVQTPLTLSVEDLKAFPADKIATLTVRRKVDDKDVPSTLRGVRLTAVLERAGLLAEDHRDWHHTIVVAIGTDGYRVVYSWPELFNTEDGADALVVFERDGQALADREGRIALAPGHDLRSGPRSVHWLARLDVRVLKE